MKNAGPDGSASGAPTGQIAAYWSETVKAGMLVSMQKLCKLIRILEEQLRLKAESGRCSLRARV